MFEFEGLMVSGCILGKLLGKGGIADIYKAYSLHRKGYCAVKIFRRGDDAMRTRFERESSLLLSLHHAHIMPVLYAGDITIDHEHTFPYMVMPYMIGGNVRTLLRREGPLGLTEIACILNQIASAIDYLHNSGYIHQDIKASNILKNSVGDYFLSDFGAVETFQADPLPTDTMELLGTAGYIAPELLENQIAPHIESDIYALGILLYEMITGRLPFVAATTTEVLSQIVWSQPPYPSLFRMELPPHAEEVVLHAIDKKPENRWKSAIELAEAFSLAIVPSHFSRIFSESVSAFA